MIAHVDQRGDDRPARRRDRRVAIFALVLAVVAAALLCSVFIGWARTIGHYLVEFMHTFS